MNTKIAERLRKIPGAVPVARSCWKLVNWQVATSQRAVRLGDILVSITTGGFLRSSGLTKLGYGFLAALIFPFAFVRLRQLRRWLKRTTVSSDANLSTHSPEVLMGIGTLGPGGSERQLSRLATFLTSQLNRKVSVIRGKPLSPSDNFFLDELRANQVEVHEYQFEAPNAKAAKNVVFGLSLLSRVAALRVQLQKQSPRVLHCWIDQTNVELGLAGYLAGVPRIILNVRSIPPYNFSTFQWYMRPIYKFLAQAPAVTFVSNTRAAVPLYAAWLGIPETRFMVIPNAVAPTVHTVPNDALGLSPQSTQIEKTKPTILGIMRLTPEKNPFLWVEIAAELHRRDIPCRTILVGHGSMKEELLAYIHEMNLADKIEVLEPRRDVQNLLLSADLLLSTSKQEGLPNVILEAQQFGVFVMATDAGGSAEAMLDGVTGSMFVSYNPREMVDEVCEALQNDGLRRAARTRGPEFVSATFDLKQITEKWLSAYGLQDEVA